MVLLGYRVGPLLAKTWKEVLDDNVPGLSAQAAYYFFFSLFPIFLFLAPLLGTIGNDRATFDLIVGQLAGAVPPEAFGLVRDFVKDVVYSPNAPGLMSVGLLLAVWAGSNVFGALMDAMNRAYDVRETRPWWKRKLISIASVFVIGGLLTVTTIMMLGGERIVDWLGALAGLSVSTRVMLAVVQSIVAAVLLVVLAAASFYFLPNVHQTWRHVLVGGAVTAFLWSVVTLAFRLYVQNFGSYNKTYGTIGGVIVLLTWMYLSMLVFLVGGELASELNRGTGAVTPRRGMLYGDRLVTGSMPARPSTDRIERVDPLGTHGA